MMGPTHCALAAVTGLGVGMAMGWDAPQAVAGSLVATLTAAGPTSPDVDNRRWWMRLDRYAPDEYLGRGGPLQHRGIMHWWGLPAAMACALAVTTPLPAQWMWAAYALVIGWASHLLGDFLVGKASVMFTRRGPGIPLMPWWGHVGVGLKCGGVVEWILGVLCMGGYVLLIWSAWR